MSQNIEFFKNLSVEVIENLQRVINDEKTLQAYRKNIKNFCRDGKLSFALTVNLLLSNLCNSMQIELHKRLIANDLEVIKSSSFSKNRYKIDWKIFEDLNTQCIKNIYISGATQLKTWHGFRLRAIDGTCLQLPNTPDIRKVFGTAKSGTKNKKNIQTTMARLLVEEDVLNKFFTRTELVPITTSELSATYDWLLNPITTGDLTLFDRNFGCFLVLYLMLKSNKHFVTRMKTGERELIREFVASGAADKIVTIPTNSALKHGETKVPKGTEIQVRLIRVVLPNGEIEVLATSLLDQEAYPTALFGELYNLRWGVETAIDVLKNKFEIMSFLAHKADGIYQEVYATILSYNIQQLLITPAQITVNEQVVKKKNKVSL